MSSGRWQRLHGRDEPPQHLRWLRAGPLDVALDGADLRYVRLADVELVRRVYVAVRDLNWDTIPEVQRETSIDELDGGFVIRSHVRSRRGDIDFTWDGRIDASFDGTISYAMEGRCESEFEFARIGICVHHPTRECAGRTYSAQTPAGQIRGWLPLTIGPQIFDHDKGYDLPLFDPFSALSIELEDGLAVDFEFHGELCEMEDQRNWTDASLKTVAMPSFLGFRHEARPGQVVSQRVVIRHRAAARTGSRTRKSTPSNRPVLTLGRPLGRTLPPIGFGVPSDGLPHTDHEAERVGALLPAHLRADVEAADEAALTHALADCEAIGADLELALHLSPGEPGLPSAVAGQLSDAPLSRILVFQRGAESTPQATIEAVRNRLPKGVPIVGGTDIYFCDLNRDRPDVAGLDGVAYSINSQVHAFDELSLVEALAGHADTVESARAIFASVPIVVSPVTLRPRFNPVAVADETPADEPELPWPVDPRQMSEFGAVWTLGSIKALSEAGASSLTYYETVGWRGLFERDAGSPRPDLFPSDPGMLFPVYNLFESLSPWAGAELIELRASDPLEVVGLALRKNGRSRLIVGNLSPRPAIVEIDIPRESEVVQLEPYGVQTLGYAAA